MAVRVLPREIGLWTGDSAKQMALPAVGGRHPIRGGPAAHPAEGGGPSWGISSRRLLPGAGFTPAAPLVFRFRGSGRVVPPALLGLQCADGTSARLWDFSASILV